ncbi:hypothetical protein OCU04_009693 [Sclerotinia nivalis]|uniref:Aminoglycoside phosphotransferase domain-containing protein n=1 Tax=Sclerotinia nivalis TaxID=352851 RepID=A0A9X0AFK6_9HELO|nr:hypothetical protein OCU04_009693 [Sclerotinia nivalis]
MDTSVCAMICSKWRMSVESVIRHDEESYIAVLKGDERRLLKLTDYGDPDNEVRMMRSVPSSVPVPKVYDHGIENEIRFLLMEYIEDSIPMSDFQVVPPTHLMKSIRKHIKAIRSVTMDYEQGSSHDHYLSLCHFGGPGYSNASDFMQKRMQGMGLPYDQSFKFKHDKLVLSHCNLWPRNVLVSKNGSKILAIIDWETAGYYPNFYEHSTFLFALRSENIHQTQFIKRWMKLFVTPDTRRVKAYENRIYNALMARRKAARSEHSGNLAPVLRKNVSGKQQAEGQEEEEGFGEEEPKSGEESSTSEEKPESGPEVNKDITHGEHSGNYYKENDGKEYQTTGGHRSTEGSKSARHKCDNCSNMVTYDTVAHLHSSWWTPKAFRSASTCPINRMRLGMEIRTTPASVASVEMR